MDVEADLKEICQPIASAPITTEAIEQIFTNSALLKSSGAVFDTASRCIWQLLYKGQTYRVTFYPEVFDENPSLRLMNFGDPLFEELSQSYLNRLI